MTPKGNANINEFIQFKNQLKNMNEGDHPATLMDQFLDQIKDSKYEMTTTNLRMDNGKTLETCIEVQEHQFIKIRHLTLEEDVS